MIRSAGFPGPWCAVCPDASGCERVGLLRPEYPACRRDLRGSPASRVAALLEEARAGAGANDPSVLALLRAVVERFGEDGLRYSEILELSASHAEARWHALRFTYGFPGARADPVRITATIRAWCGIFGPQLGGWAGNLLRPLLDRCVHHPIFGFAWDGPGRWRVKLYLEFHSEAGSRALSLAGRLVGRALEDFRQGDRPLQLIGLDLGPRGLSGAKLYFLERDLSLGEPAAVAIPLLRDLVDAGVGRLRDALLIRRIRGPDDRSGEPGTEIDFTLPENALHWDAIRGLPSFARLRGNGNPLDRLALGFRLGVRNVTAGPGGKLNVYYVLAEGPAGRSPRADPHLP